MLIYDTIIFLLSLFKTFPRPNRGRPYIGVDLVTSCIDDIQYVAMPHCIRVFNIIHVCLYKGITGNSVTWYVIPEDVSDSAISVASCSAHTHTQKKIPCHLHKTCLTHSTVVGGSGGRTVVFLLAVEMDIGEDLRITSLLTVNGWW